MLTVTLHQNELKVDAKTIRLIYNLGSSLEINEQILQQFDVVLLNVLEELTFQHLEEDALFAFVSIDERALRRLFASEELRFVCDSSRDKNDNFVILKDCLAKLLLATVDRNHFAQAEFQKRSYELYLILMQYFRVNRLSVEKETLEKQFASYIDSHFQSDLTLSQMSSDFYMTPQYFLKLFKQTMGKTFYKYVTNSRLAYGESLLRNEQLSILQIALDSGFPNLTAFNKAFKEKHHQLPSHYRKLINSQAVTSQISKDYSSLSEVLHEQILLEKGQPHILRVDVSHRDKRLPYWRQVINLGRSEALSQHQAQQQFLMVQDELQFESIRLRLQCPTVFEGGGYSFYKEEEYLDFLVKQGLVCQIVIDFRDYQQFEHYEAYLTRFLSHFSNRYSIDRVRKWRFELDYGTIFDELKCQVYFAVYRRVTLILERFSIEASLYGPGLLLGDMKSLSLILNYVKQEGVDGLSHLTFRVLPEFVDREGEHAIVFYPITDVNHLKNQLEMTADLLAGERYLIHIVEWKDYSDQQVWINDSAFKAANRIKTTIACFGLLDSLAYASPLDLLGKEDREGGIISGIEGLVTKHGIKKPVYYSHHFLNRQGTDFVAKDKHSFVTAQGKNISIVSHHCATLNYRYYRGVRSGDNYPYDGYFEDLPSQKLIFKLENITPGTYLIKTRLINRKSGSVQDKMAQVFLDSSSHFGDAEIAFLKAQAIPELSLSHRQTEDGRLTLSYTLEPNEIRHTHIIYLY